MKGGQNMSIKNVAPKRLGNTTLYEGKEKGYWVDEADPQTGHRVVHQLALTTPFGRLYADKYLTSKEYQMAEDYRDTFDRAGFPAGIAQQDLSKPMGSHTDIVEETDINIAARKRLKKLAEILGTKNNQVVWYACGYCQDIHMIAFRLTLSLQQVKERLKNGLNDLINAEKNNLI